MNKNLIIFVNGYTHNCKPYKAYWTEKGSQFLDAANIYFGGNCSFLFVNGEGAWYSGAKSRYRKGKRFAETELKEIHTKLTSESKIFFVTHSMGAAFAEGMTEFLVENKLNVAKLVHFSVADAKKIMFSNDSKHIPRVQLNMTLDKTLKKHANPFTHFLNYKIPEIHVYGEVLSQIEKMHPKVLPKHQIEWDFHYDTKTFPSVWGYLQQLENTVVIFDEANKHFFVKNENLNCVFRLLFWRNSYLLLDENSLNEKRLIYREVCLRKKNGIFSSIEFL
ncbi:MAG: hypothetical protein ACK5B9_15625 [Flavobacteriia bacterium]